MRASLGGAAVVGDVLQAAHQSVGIGTDAFGRGSLLQSHATLPGRSLSGADHAVDLLETLKGQRSQISVQSWAELHMLRLLTL